MSDSEIERLPASRVLPTRAQTLIFTFKAWGLRLRRALRDAVDMHRPQRHRPAIALCEAPVRAESLSELWPCDESDAALVTGKLHNLRLAMRHLDGIEVPAHATFSFWKQVGRASRGRGYVVGRELREGCVIPAIGGGLCQLSNAVYDSAARAGLEIVERHRHSRVIPGSLAEQGRDATVFWNYVDLRLRAPFAWRLDVRMDARMLRVGIRSAQVDAAAASPRWRSVPIAVASASVEHVVPVTPAVPHGDCSSCGQVQCHMHTGPSGLRLRPSWWMTEAWPEFLAHWAQQHARDASVPLHRLDLANRRPWQRAVQGAHWRYGRWRGHALPQLRLAQMQGAAQRLLRRLQPEDVDLVLPQSLLPFLWRAGALAGRRFSVLMTAQPMTTLQAQLDRAAALHPDVASLRDFRADPELITAEAQALQVASAWISPHAAILQEAGSRARALPWVLPPALERNAARADGPPRLFFAASALARKGIFELLGAVREFPVEVLLAPGDSEPGLAQRLPPQGARLRRVASYREGLRQADAVVLPAWVEHHPRALLHSIASGIPVIATPACGLGAELPWQRVEAGDVPGLREAVARALGLRAEVQ